MKIQIYERKSTETIPVPKEVVELVRVIGDQIIFRSQEFLPVQTGLTYYCMRPPEGPSPELWAISFADSRAVKPPYIYTGTFDDKWLGPKV